MAKEEEGPVLRMHNMSECTLAAGPKGWTHTAGPKSGNGSLGGAPCANAPYGTVLFETGFALVTIRPVIGVEPRSRFTVPSGVSSSGIGKRST